MPKGVLAVLVVLEVLYTFFSLVTASQFARLVRAAGGFVMVTSKSFWTTQSFVHVLLLVSGLGGPVRKLFAVLLSSL